MGKAKIHTPFFVFNPKSFLYGDELLDMAKVSEEMAHKYPISVFVTVPFADIAAVSSQTDKVIVTAQHFDGIRPGRGMGHVLPESLYHAGARAVFLNHAENPLTLSELVKAIERADELDMTTIVCADSIAEAKAVAMLDPDIILCEPTELIGSGKVSDESYIRDTNAAIKKINPNVLVMQAAGISSADDVHRMISLQADGTGCTSGIIAADDPRKMLRDMIEAAFQASDQVFNHN